MSPDALEAQTKALRAMSVEQRILTAEALRAFAWELKRSALQRRHPGLSETEILSRVRAAFGHELA